MITLGAWIVALFLAFAGPRLPGGSVMWIGLGFVVFAGAAIVEPDASWPYLGAIFLLVAVGNLIRLKYISGDFIKGRGEYDVKGANKGKHVGKIATVSKAVRGGFGMVMIKDDPWQVRSAEDIPAGAKVKIVGMDGDYLTVARAEEPA